MSILSYKRLENRRIRWLFQVSCFHFRKLESYKTNLLSSSFYDKLREDLKKCCDDLGVDEIEQIICYGLGNFTECLIAKYQLALLMLIKSLFEAEVYIYDPVFSSVEIEFLKNLQLVMIDGNEEGVRDVNCTSLIYMPHCPTPLINNLLWHNWGPKISNCIIFGNSFQSLFTSQPEHQFRKQFAYIHSILPYTKELEIANIFMYTDIFNDISLHYFPPSISDLPVSFWKNKTKPEYDDTDVECISNKLRSTNINDDKIDEKAEGNVC